MKKKFFLFMLFSLFLASCSDTIKESVEEDLCATYYVYDSNPSENPNFRYVALPYKIGDMVASIQIINDCSSALYKKGYRVESLHFWCNPDLGAEKALNLPNYVSAYGEDWTLAFVQVHPDPLVFYAKYYGDGCCFRASSGLNFSKIEDADGKITGETFSVSTPCYWLVNGDLLSGLTTASSYTIDFTSSTRFLSGRTYTICAASDSGDVWSANFTVP